MPQQCPINEHRIEPGRHSNGGTAAVQDLLQGLADLRRRSRASRYRQLCREACQATASDYDSFAEAYSAENEVNLFNASTSAGFRIAAIDEPLPAPAAPRELLPAFLKDKPRGAGFLCFMLFVLAAD